MEVAPALQQSLAEIAAIEQRHLQCVKKGDSRLANAEKRIAAADARILECQREHDAVSAEEEARLNIEIEKLKARTQRMLSDIRAREREAREKRQVIEAQTQQLLLETETIRTQSQ